MSLRTGIEVPLSPQPVTGFRRVARLHAFIVTADLNMILQVVICLLDEQGRPKSEEIKELKMSEARTMEALRQFQDVLLQRETAGAYVDATGAFATAPLLGEENPTVIPQRDFFQSITLGQLKAMGGKTAASNTFADLLYFMIEVEIGKLDRLEVL